jgi:flagellar hook-associated protein 3 FlgL
MAALVSIDTTLARIAGHASVARDAAMALSVRQVALGQIDTLSGDAASQLLASGQGGAVATDGAARMVASQFQTFVAALNQRVADRSVFAGTASDVAALAPPADIVAAARAAVGAASGPADFEALLDGWLADPAGFAAAAYRGGPPAPPLPVAAGEVVAADATALDPALRQTAKGLLMGALLDGGAFAGDPATRAHLARRAGEVLAASAADRAELAGRLGQAEARIAEAQSRHQSERAALEIARGGLVAADPYDTATALQETEARLERIFTLTARLSRLSLAERL